MFTPDTTTLLSLGLAETISPVLPLSRPESTTTLSPLRIFAADMLQYLRREADDLHMLLRAQFTNHRPENAGPDRLFVLVDQHRGVGVEADHRAIGAADVLCRADDDGAV